MSSFVERLRSTLDAPGRIGEVIEVLAGTYVGWRDDRTIRLGAGLAYYGLFSLTSVLTLSLGLSRVFLSGDELAAELGDQIEATLGEPGVELATMLGDALGGGFAATQLGLIGLGSLLVTGSLFFLALEDALNQIWGLPVRVGLRSTIRRRLISLLVLFAAAGTLVLSLTAQAVTSLLTALVPGSFTGVTYVASLVASAVTWVILCGAIALLFRFLPSAPVPWRAAIVGAIVTAIMIVIGTALIGWYLRTFGVSSVSGAASSVLAVLVWIFYEAQIVLVGAQLTHTLSERQRDS